MIHTAGLVDALHRAEQRAIALEAERDALGARLERAHQEMETLRRKLRAAVGGLT